MKSINLSVDMAAQIKLKFLQSLLLFLQKAFFQSLRFLIQFEYY